MSAGAPVELRLLGQRIALRSQGDPGRAEEVVRLVTSCLERAEARGKGQNAPHLVALLALLDLAEEYLAAQDRVERQREELLERTRELRAYLDGSSGNEGGKDGLAGSDRG